MKRTLIPAWTLLWAMSAGCFPPVDKAEDVDSVSEDTTATADSAIADSATPPDTAVTDSATPPDTAVDDTTPAKDTVAAPDTGQGHPCVGGCAPSTVTCKVSQCDTATGTCVEVDAADGVECNDGHVCTVGDKCLGGQCLSAQNSCDDGVACTDGGQL